MESLDNTMKMRLIECLNRNGIEHLSSSPEYDSLSFITAIVDIENEFGITFPDELLNLESFSSLETLLDIVNNQMLITEVDEHQT